MKMEKQENVTKNSKIEKEIKVLCDIFEGSALFGGIVGGFLVVALMMAGASELTANLTMNAKAGEVFASSGYQIFAEEGLNELDKKLQSGKIGEKEYQEGIDALYSIPEVIRYAETASDEELTSFIESYNESKEMARTIMTKGVPVFGTTTAVSLAGAAAALSGAKKTRKKLEEDGEGLDAEEVLGK